MKTKIMTVTPSMAAQWIKDYSNPKNRNISKVKVQQYRREMDDGKWQMNGETICFDVNGVLLNGHHRIMALSKASRPIEMLIVSGVDSSAFTTIDTGIKRSGAHTMQMAGVGNGAAMSSVITAKIMYKNALDRDGSFNSYVRPTNSDILNEYNSNMDAYDFSLKMVRLIQKLCPTSISGHLPTYAIIEKGHDKSNVDMFFQRLSDGVMLPADSPIHTLRNLLIKAKSDKSKGESGRSANWMKNAFVLSWNKHIAGTSNKKIQILDPNKAIQIK